MHASKSNALAIQGALNRGVKHSLNPARKQCMEYDCDTGVYVNQDILSHGGKRTVKEVNSLLGLTFHPFNQLSLLMKNRKKTTLVSIYKPEGLTSSVPVDGLS